MTSLDGIPGDRDLGRTATEPLPEGDEAPPPGVRTMAAVRWGLVALMALAAVGSWVHVATRGAGVAQAAVQYRCPMHPSVLQVRPGSCPVCGMDLVPATDASPHGGEARAGAADAHGHPQAGAADAHGHPQAGAADAHGHPQAGAARVAGTGAVASAGRYWCPMHPDVTSDDPEARCPKCGGMRLLPRPGAAPEGVPGLTAVAIGPEQARRAGIRTAPAVRRPLGAELRTTGFVAANESALVLVTSRTAGWIESLGRVQTGQRVEKGAVLARLYGPELTAAQQVFLNAVRWNANQSSLAPVQTASGPERDARRRLELLGVAREDVDALARSGAVLDAVPIRAPAAGYVARRSAVVGQYVQPGTELFELADLSTVWVVADVHEADLARVEVGRRIRFLVAAHPGAAFEGKVQFVYPAVNPETHTAQARVQLPNRGLLLRPGMYGDVVIDLPSEDRLTVPRDAVVDTGERQYLFVAPEAGRFEPRRVRVGARTEDRVEILDGLSEGERVVTAAAFLVDSESRLRAAVERFAAPDDDDHARPPAPSAASPGSPASTASAASAQREAAR